MSHPGLLGYMIYPGKHDIPVVSLSSNRSRRGNQVLLIGRMWCHGPFRRVIRPQETFCLLGGTWIWSGSLTIYTALSNTSYKSVASYLLSALQWEENFEKKNGQIERLEAMVGSCVKEMVPVCLVA